MAFSIIYLVVGAVMILYGADRLTAGSTSLALRMHVTEGVIGLTVVAFGTSMPEFFTSLVASLHGSADLSIGNIVGSNIFNVLAIMGCSALLAPVAVSRNTLTKDIPFGVLSSVVLIVLCFDNIFVGADASNFISFGDGIVLLCFFCVFMWYTVMAAKNGVESETKSKSYSLLKTLLYIIFGLVCLIFGADFFVRGATDMARIFGVSEAVIGLTVVAMGTSLPELATSVIAAYRGHADLAIGNVVGSCVFNILWILGFCGVIAPMHVQGITLIDMLVCLGSMLLLWLFSFSKHRVSRSEGVFMLFAFIVYISYLIYNA